jgi:hypothetical protein
MSGAEHIKSSVKRHSESISFFDRTNVVAAFAYKKVDL